jgi:hypothetical protein
MRKEGRNPACRVAEVVGDAVAELDPTCGADTAHSILATRNYRENFPARGVRTPTAFERHATAHHEAAHAVVAVLAPADSIGLRLGKHGGGECRVSGIAKPEDRITFALAGAIAEARFHPQAIHKYTDGSSCYDFLVARLLIDQLNDSGAQIHLTYRSAAKRAMVFVDANWSAIENVALALNDSGELDDYSIRLFAKCER